MDDSSGRPDSGEVDVYERNIANGSHPPKLSLLRAVADVHGVDETELPPLYSCIDEMVEQFYSDPPSAEAQAELEFSYSDYRITLFQNGLAVLQRRK